MTEIRRPVQGRVELRGLPRPGEGELSNREWMKDVVGAARPTWVEGPRGWDGYWTVARDHLEPLVRAVALRLGQVDVRMEYRSTEQCDLRCQNAKGDDCTCSCHGVNHGHARPAGWMQVGGTTLVAAETEQVLRRVTRADVLAGRAG